MTLSKTHKEISKGCGVILEFNGKILLLKRSPSKKFEPNKWNLPGGHCEPDEDPKAGAIRELYEESGIKISDATLIGSKILETGTIYEINYFVFYKKIESKPKVIINEESSEYNWFDISTIDKMPLAKGEDESFKMLKSWRK